MKLETLRYTQADGWSDDFPAFDSPQTLVIAFGSPHFLTKPDPIQTLARAYPTSHVIGCSTAGEILDKEISDESLVVSVLRFTATTLASLVLPMQDPDDSYQAGVKIAELLTAPDLKGVMIFSEGITVNGSQLIEGINAVLPPTVIVTGGLAGDGPHFAHTWIIKGDMPCEGYVSAVGFYGEHVQIGHGSQGGWETYGKEYLITSSRNNILYEIDHRPALQLYKEQMKERVDELPASALLFPLALHAHAGDKRQTVRTILGVDEETQSITFAGDMPEGYHAQFMHASASQLINGAAGAALMMRVNAAQRSTLMIAISCVGRRLVLKERTKEELEVISNVLPKVVRQIGFYSYGEISPYTNGVCELHNQTMTLTSISEV